MPGAREPNSEAAKNLFMKCLLQKLHTNGGYAFNSDKNPRKGKKVGHRAKSSTSCQHCFSHKAKCVRENGPDAPCQQCAKKGKACLPSTDESRQAARAAWKERKAETDAFLKSLGVSDERHHYAARTVGFCHILVSRERDALAKVTREQLEENVELEVSRSRLAQKRWGMTKKKKDEAYISLRVARKNDSPAEVVTLLQMKVDQLVNDNTQARKAFYKAQKRVQRAEQKVKTYGRTAPSKAHADSLLSKIARATQDARRARANHPPPTLKRKTGPVQHVSTRPIKRAAVENPKAPPVRSAGQVSPRGVASGNGAVGQ